MKAAAAAKLLCSLPLGGNLARDFRLRVLWSSTSKCLVSRRPRKFKKSPAISAGLRAFEELANLPSGLRSFVLREGFENQLADLVLAVHVQNRAE